MQKSHGSGILPKLFIIGAPKCGTTFLHNMLSVLDGFVAPKIKEPNFFEYDRNYQRGLDSYRSLFRHDGGTGGIAFESTPWYVYSPVAAERIYNGLGPNCRFVLCVRDPIERAVSMYRDLVGAGREDRPFRKTFEGEIDEVRKRGPQFAGRFTSYLSGGFYAKALEPWIDIFGVESISILDLSIISRRPEEAVCAVATAMNGGLPSCDGLVISEHRNPASGIRSPKLERLGKSLFQSALGRMLQERVPWRFHAALVRLWRRSLWSSDRAADIAAEDIDWLREAATPLFVDDSHELWRSGVEGIEDWATCRTI
jgi:hypothetical protein